MVDAYGTPRFRNYGSPEGMDDMSESSLRYDAPELISGQVEFRTMKTDIWALGCTAGEVRLFVVRVHPRKCGSLKRL